MWPIMKEHTLKEAIIAKIESNRSLFAPIVGGSITKQINLQ